MIIQMLFENITFLSVNKILEISPMQNIIIALPAPMRPKNAWWNIGLTEFNFSKTLMQLYEDYRYVNELKTLSISQCTQIQ